MIEYSNAVFFEIKKYFPELEYSAEFNKIFGKISVGPCHYKKITSAANLLSWEINPCDEKQSDAIVAEYIILIDLNKKDYHNNSPMVWETSEKIQNLAKEMNKSSIDLHVYPDNRCCLGIRINEEELSLSNFIFEDVYPFFAWQGYFAKYKKEPPCGSYSHGKKGLDEALQEHKNSISSLAKRGRNEPCPCNSGKKYKKCCLHGDQEKKHSLLYWEKRKKMLGGNTPKQ